MATPVLTPSGKYRLRVYVQIDAHGKQIYKSFTADTPAACNKAYKRWQKEGGNIIVPEEAADSGPTLGEAIENYISRCESGRVKSYSPSTIRGYRICQRSFAPYDNLLVKDLTIDDIQDYVEYRATTCGLKTIKNDLYLLQPALRRAKRKDLDFSELELPEDEEEEYIIPQDDEIQAMLTYFKDDDDMSVAIMMGAFLGMRRSEACAITWGDIDQENLVIHISKARVMDEFRNYTTKATKTRAGKRDLDISEDMLKVFKRRAVVGGILFSPAAPLIQISPEAVSARFRKARNALGYSFTFHGLRHYHASVMLALDLPKKYIVSDMGHSDFTMVERTYGQIVKDKKKTVSAVVHAHADTVLSGKRYNW